MKVGGEDADHIFVVSNYLSFRAPYLRPNKSPRDSSHASYVQVLCILNFLQFYNLPSDYFFVKIKKKAITLIINKVIFENNFLDTLITNCNTSLII